MLLHLGARGNNAAGLDSAPPLVSHHPAGPRMSFSREHCNAEFLSPSVVNHCGFSGLCQFSLQMGPFLLLGNFATKE